MDARTTSRNVTRKYDFTGNRAVYLDDEQFVRSSAKLLTFGVPPASGNTRFPKASRAELRVRNRRMYNYPGVGQYLAMTFSCMRINVRAETTVRIALLKRDTHVSGNKGIALITGGTLLASASNVTGRTVARGLPVRSEMARAGKPILQHAFNMRQVI